MKFSRQVAVALCVVFAASIAAPVFGQQEKGATPYREPPPLGDQFKNKLKRGDEKGETKHQAAKDLMAQGKYEEAIPLLQGVVTDDPRNDDAWNDLGLASRRLGRNADAVGYYERALAIRSSRKDTRGLLGEVQLAMDNLAKAEEQRDKLKQLCTEGCAELQTLEGQIAAYKTAHPA